MMDIRKVLDLALEKGLIEGEQHAAVLSKVLEFKFTQEDVNRIVSERLKREKGADESEAVNLKVRELEEALKRANEETVRKEAELATKMSTLEKEAETIRAARVASLLEKNIGGLKILPTYRQMIKLTENEEELKASIKEVFERQKTDLEQSGLGVVIGGGSGSRSERDLSKLSTTDLLRLGFKENQ